MEKETRRLCAVAVECLGIAGVGIGCELAFGGHVHLVAITAGSCLVSIGGLIWAKAR